MLLVIQDKGLAGDVRNWTTRSLTEGIRRRAREVTVVEHLGDETLRTAGGGQVVTLRSDTDRDRMLATAASAAAVVLITEGNAQGVRPWLNLDNGSGWKVPIVVVSVTDEPAESLDLLAATAGVSQMRNIRPAPHRRAVRLLNRMGKSLAVYAVQPRRFEAGDAATHRAGARQQAEDLLRELMDIEDVEEYQVFGGGRMQVQYSDGRREDRESPFADDHSLEEAIKFLATFGGSRPHRFDEQHPRLDMNLKDRWRLHAEGFVVRPMYLALRANMGGRLTLEQLGFADHRLNSLLVGAVAGTRRANTIVAATMSGGKTTLLQALLAHTPAHERVDTIEDTPELQVPHPNWIRETVRGSQKGEGSSSAVTMFDLLKAALRQRPNEIIIGEIRGEEGAICFQAMQTGHAAMSTFHAASVEKLIQRLTGNPINIPKTYIDNLNVVTIQSAVRLPNGKDGRRVVSVNEIVGYDSFTDSFSFIEVFRWNPVDDTFEFSGYMNSYLLEEKIAMARGLPPHKKRNIYNELTRRANILKRLQQQGVVDFNALYQVLSQAYRERVLR